MQNHKTELICFERPQASAQTQALQMAASIRSFQLTTQVE